MSDEPNSPWNKSLRKIAEENSSQDTQKPSSASAAPERSEHQKTAYKKPQADTSEPAESASKSSAAEYASGNKSGPWQKSRGAEGSRSGADGSYSRADGSRSRAEGSRSAKPYGEQRTGVHKKPASGKEYGSDKKHDSDKKYSSDKKHSSDRKPCFESKPGADRKARYEGKPGTDRKSSVGKRPDSDKKSESLWNKTQAQGLHPKNPHNGRYDMAALCAAEPVLERFLTTNPRGEQTVDFSEPDAVVCLNRALLKAHYGLNSWQLPKGYLCPPIPGRADYLCYLNDLLAEDLLAADFLVESGARNTPPRLLDIGTGANLIYPIIGHLAYGWQFVAADTDAIAVRNAHQLVSENSPLLDAVEIRMQRHPEQIFKGMIGTGEYFEFTLCNPPFFASEKEAQAQARRKWRNLKGQESSVKRNFGGKSNELWCEGGELAFAKRMITESADYAAQVGWFTCLISKEDNIAPLKRELKRIDVKEVKVIAMAQGQKQSRFIAWRF
ncbi:MAG: 23S rRNA (adenine(1618)-N(6))-methyltransferase RlmF [Oceanospirillaceae bacterium]|nr:23S rRNA (adenine(1618)-N(6))-methyltransferase RlmF [Oceanospirillaceae bacterium]MBS53922.1 23S rRNA (adenine(1618)-N(6))-methyltransferase RlmF [Oceanospirillaceae bacterium]